MLKAALGQFDVIPGRPDLNSAAMLKMIEQAKKSRAQLIIFPEMAIPGYLLGDTWEQPSFIRDCEYFGQKIIQASEDICIIFGNVGVDWDKKGYDGRVRKYNACFVAYQKKLLQGDNALYPFVIKTLHPNYREFDDTRHFFSLLHLALESGRPIEKLIQPVQVDFPGAKLNLGCLLCEDGWSEDYTIKPLDILRDNYHIDLFVNVSSSPFTSGKNDKRNRIFSLQAKKAHAPLIYVNSVGIQNNGKTVYTFDGFSTVYSQQGTILDFIPPFKEELKIVDMDLSAKEDHPTSLPVPNDWCMDSIFQALEYGLKKFLTSIKINKMVIGLSGGIDSAVGAALYTHVLGPENVLLVNMPSIFSSNTTQDLARQLAKNLGCLYAVMPIQDSVDYTIRQIEETPLTDLVTGEVKHLSVSSFVGENIQARDRSARILAGMAASFGGGFNCNANKSELTVGYSTLYGDQAGVMAVLGDLWKHQVYALAEYLNQQVFQSEVIPRGIIEIVPSAELSFDQAVDEGKGDPLKYPYHDYLFRAFMEHWQKATPEDLLQWYLAGTLEEKIGCEKGLAAKFFPTVKDFIDDLERWWNLYSGIAVAKRIQAPPILAVSRRAYGFDHREAQNGPYYTARYLAMKKEIFDKN